MPYLLAVFGTFHDEIATLYATNTSHPVSVGACIPVNICSKPYL